MCPAVLPNQKMEHGVLQSIQRAATHQRGQIICAIWAGASLKAVVATPSIQSLANHHFQQAPRDPHKHEVEAGMFVAAAIPGP